MTTLPPYTRTEAASLLGKSVATVDRRLRDGSLPRIKLGGSILIPRQPIDDIVTATRSTIVASQGKQSFKNSRTGKSTNKPAGRKVV